MLLPIKLKSYLETCQSEITQIGNTIALADDSEFAKFVDGISTEDTSVSLIGVIPNIRGKGDEESLKFSNHLLLYCVKKTDARAGHKNYLQIFEDCGNAIRALIDKFIKDQTNGGGKCAIGEFVFNNLTIEPLIGYMGANGWVLSIGLVTS